MIIAFFTIFSIKDLYISPSSLNYCCGTMYVFICNFCVWYNVYQEIIMQTATQTKTKQTQDSGGQFKIKCLLSLMFNYSLVLKHFLWLLPCYFICKHYINIPYFIYN